MSRFSKILYSISGMFLLLLLGLTTLEFAREISLPTGLPIQLPSINRSGVLGELYVNYLFWASLVFFILALLGIIIVILYPQTSIDLALEDGKSGTLVLKKSAIEGLVKTIVSENGYMKSPTVKVTLYRKKINVIVSGKIIPRTDILKKTQELSSDIEANLKAFLGITKNIQFTVDVKHVEEKKKTTSGRVE